MKKIFFVCSVLVPCATGMLFADARVGYVSSMEVINNAKVGKDIKEKLDAAFKKSGAEVQAEEQRITKAVSEFKNKESAMAETARESEQAKLMKMRRDFESMVQEKDEEIKRLQAKFNDELTKEAIKTAAEMAQTESLDVVVDIDSGRALYVAPKANYTSKFIEHMNKHSETAKAPAVPAKAKA